MEQDFRKRFFWPLMVAFVGAICLLAFQQRHENEPRPSTSFGSSNQPFDLLITSLTAEKQTLELQDVEFEHWQKQSIAVDILTPGLIRTELLKYLPQQTVKKMLDTRWNQSRAEIITHCKASVELEVSVQHADAWKITINGNTADITAPALVADKVNIQPETVKGWVLEEDWLIDGQEKRDQLVKSIRPHLQRKVRSHGFIRQHRDACRQSLSRMMTKLIALANPKLQIDHVYVTFSDEGNASEKTKE
ncbi:hypothetical protein BVY04_01175 [bacterium M21]|nr:hypothetical protein BVY04_01175 [bacterium M21]